MAWWGKAEPKIMKVHLFPDPILNTKMVKIPPLDDHFQHWVTEMFELMYKSRGIGLAAPQVGLHYRFFLMDVAEETEEERKTEQKNEAQGEGGENLEEEEDFEEEDLEPLLPKNPKVILDPSVIFAHKETAVLEEGCLSIPKIKIEIERPSKIDVCYQNLQGERV